MDIFSFEVLQTTQYVLFKENKAYFIYTSLQGLFKTDIEVSIYDSEKEDILQEADQTYVSFKVIENVKYRFPENKREVILAAFKEVSDQGPKYFERQTDSAVIDDSAENRWASPADECR